MNRRTVLGLAACLLLLAAAPAAQAQTKTMPTRPGGTTATPPGGTVGSDPTTTTNPDESSLPMFVRLVILFQTLDDVMTLANDGGAQIGSDLELLMLVVLLYEQRVAEAEAALADGTGVLGGLFGGGK